MRSVDLLRGAGCAVAGAGVAVMLAGCTTTMTEAARLQLNSARIRAAEQRTIVDAAGSAAQVSAVSLLATPGTHTFVVTVRNPGASAVTDLPISVGVRVPGRRRRYLNARSTQELSYFDSHLPRIAPRSSVRWVFATTTSLPRRSRPFALVGARPSPSTAPGRTAPAIVAQVARATSAARGQGWLVLRLHNRSSITQYQLPVYAVALRGRRPVAAGATIVTQLGGLQTLSLRVPIRGSLSGARIEVTALPTIVH